MKFSLVIPVAGSGIPLLLLNIPYLITNLDAEHIYIITSKKFFLLFKHLKSKITLIDEDSLLPGLTYDTIKKKIVSYGIAEKRTGWYLQQFLKMSWCFFSADKSEWYLVWDADTIPLKKIALFEADKPVFIKKAEYNEPYFQTLKKILDLHKIAEFSFIAERMIINKKIMIELLLEIEKKTQACFYDGILCAAGKSTRPECAFSEFETYGTFVYVNYQNLYAYRESSSYRFAAKTYGLQPSQYDLWRLSKKYEVVSFEKCQRQIKPYIWFQKQISKLFFILSGSSHD